MLPRRVRFPAGLHEGPHVPVRSDGICCPEVPSCQLRDNALNLRLWCRVYEVVHGTAYSVLLDNPPATYRFDMT